MGFRRGLLGGDEVPGGEGALESCAGTAFRGHETDVLTELGAAMVCPPRHSPGQRIGAGQQLSPADFYVA